MHKKGVICQNVRLEEELRVVLWKDDRYLIVTVLFNRASHWPYPLFKIYTAEKATFIKAFFILL